MSEPVTRVVVNIQRNETLTYLFNGDMDSNAALDKIASGEYDPVESNIRSEDMDLVAFESFGICENCSQEAFRTPTAYRGLVCRTCIRANQDRDPGFQTHVSLGQ